MSMLRTFFLTLLLVVPVALPSSTFARPNDGRYQQSVEARKKTIACANLKLELEAAEDLADEQAGTPAAKPYAELADKAWAEGEKLGCSWTA
jgi:hypothetical protein